MSRNNNRKKNQRYVKYFLYIRVQKLKMFKKQTVQNCRWYLQRI